MDRYLILSDLDKTLLNNDSKLSEKTICYLQKIIDDGHIFSICTGRPFQAAFGFFKQINRNIPMVTDNGANIFFPYNPNMKKISWTISRDSVKSLIKRIKPYYISSLTNGDNVIYLENRDYLPGWLIHQEDGREVIDGKMVDILNEDPTLFMIYVDNNGETLFEEALKDYKEITFRKWKDQSNVISYELYSKDASKGKALEKLKELYNIKNECTMAFGDERNDLELIIAAHYGVAMKNGNKKVKKMAKYISHFNNQHNGVIRFIKKHIK